MEKYLGLQKSSIFQLQSEITERQRLQGEREKYIDDVAKAGKIKRKLKVVAACGNGTPTQAPASVINGPPDEPGLIAASICSASSVTHCPRICTSGDFNFANALNSASVNSVSPSDNFH